jgi:hypothetical protein
MQPISRLDEWVGRRGLSHLTMEEFYSSVPLLDVMTEKVNTLEGGSFAEQQLEGDVRLLIELLRATLARRYQRLSILAFAQILVALDYFLKVHDDKPDTQDGGYLDDHQIIIQVIKKCGPEIEEFRAWQLRNESLG